MKRTVTTAVVLVVLLSVATPALGTSGSAGVSDESGAWAQTAEPTETATATGTANESNTTGTSPGARLGGVVAVQGTELGGELESRSFDHQLNRSESNRSKAAAVARQAQQSQSRLDALRTARQELEMAHENGSISESEYRVRAAALSARASNVRRMTDQTSTAATGLPNETLEANGVNVTALRALRSMAQNLEGGEIATIAREIAGRNVGGGVGPSENARRGGGPPAVGDAGENRQSGGSNETARGGENATAQGGQHATAGQQSGSPGGGQANPSDQRRGPANETNPTGDGRGPGSSQRGQAD